MECRKDRVHEVARFVRAETDNPTGATLLCSLAAVIISSFLGNTFYRHMQLCTSHRQRQNEHALASDIRQPSTHRLLGFGRLTIAHVYPVYCRCRPSIDHRFHRPVTFSVFLSIFLFVRNINILLPIQNTIYALIVLSDTRARQLTGSP